jgi:ankyrin repeat protein
MEALLEAGADPNIRVTRNVWYMQYARSELSVDVAGATPFWRAAYAQDVDAMKLLVKYHADPSIPTYNTPPDYASQPVKPPSGESDPSGLPPVPIGGPGIYPIHAAAGVGYGQGSAGYVHRGVPNGWLPAVKYLVEDLGADVNARDRDGYTAMHHAAARGDNETIKFLLAHGADPKAVARSGQTTVDMANGPVQRIQPFPETIALLEALGVKNNHHCVSC